MTSEDFNWLMIGLILIALALVGYIALKFGGRWWLWLVPAAAILVLGLLYSGVYIGDVSDGAISNPILFNQYNQILRGSTYIIIIAYLLAIITVRRKVMGMNKKHG